MDKQSLIHGEALATGFLTISLIGRMYGKGLFTKPEIESLMDEALRALEGLRGALKGGEDAVDYARSQIEALRMLYASPAERPLNPGQANKEPE